MSDPEGPDLGLAGSVRRVVDSLLGLAQNRASLFAVEFHEERLRLIDRIFWMAVGLCLGLIGLAVATAALALFLWRTTGFTGLLLLAAVFIVAAAIVLIRLRRQVCQAPRPFAETLAEFEKDRACLRDKN
jgi:uncharacterized membrane protein YqjE